MCLAISPGKQCKRGRLAEYWYRVAKTPLRLFLFAALVHMLVFAGILLFADLPDATAASSYLVSAIAFGLIALPVFGYVLTRLPRMYSISALHYARYSGIYMLFMTALALLEIGMLFGPGWALAGVWLLVPGWLLALSSLRYLHEWMPVQDQMLSKALIALLVVMLVMLLVHAMTFTLDLVYRGTMPMLALVLIWPVTLILTAVISKNVSHKDSEITL